MAESLTQNMLGPVEESRGEAESGQDGILPGPNDIVIAVMGDKGSGKTTFIQHFTNESLEISHGLESSTKQVKFVRCNLPDGTTFYLVDTPGFDNIFRNGDNVLEDIARSLCKIYISKILLTGVIFFYREDEDGFTNFTLYNLRMFTHLCGAHNAAGVVLATTMWDEAIFEKSKAREEELISTHATHYLASLGRTELVINPSNRRFWRGILRYGSRVIRQDATRESAINIVQFLINRNQPVILQLQEEMVDEDRSLDQTSIWRELGFQLEAPLRQRTLGHDDEIEKQLKQMREALTESNRILKKDLVDHKKVVERGMRKYEDEGKKQRSKEEEAQKIIEEPIAARTQSEILAGMLSPEQMKTHLTSSGFLSIRTTLNLVWEAVQRLFRPPTCGELLYGDFREASTGSLEKLAAKLKQHTGQAPQQDSSTIAQHPLNVQARQSGPLVGWDLPNINQGNSSSTTNQSTTTSPSNPTLPPRKALQLCVETGKFTIELSELDFKQIYSDGMLFQMIRAKYESVRQSVLPMRLRFRKPEKALFVKFRLASRPLVSPIAGSIEKPSIPPEAEVQAGNYEYTPCPIEEPPIDSRTFFHHFYSPASKHPASMWGERLPWKVGPSLVVPMSQGWGIQLEESPDWPLFFALMFLILLMSGLVAGIYAWQTKDHQTGVAIGAWLTTVQAMGMSAVFFWWT